MRKTTDQQTQARAYLHAMAGELSKIAAKNDLETLRYLFEMAEHEAAGLGEYPSLFEYNAH